jgi:hypothetical protein
MMRPFLTISMSALLSSALPNVAVAQCNGTISAGHSTCTLPVTATAVINTVAKLSTTSLTTTLSAPNAIDFGTSAGRHDRGTNVTVRANRAFASGLGGHRTWTDPPNSKRALISKMKVGRRRHRRARTSRASSTGTAGVLTSL